MIEKVARAICSDDFNTFKGHSPGECEYCDSQREMVMKQAKAAIEAMREPTEEMKKAADDLMDKMDNFGYNKNGIGFVDPIYQAMIDAALKE